MAALDWAQCAAVESVPGKVSGAWVLRGTRMPVATIFENLEAGVSLDDILCWFDGLNREQVKAAGWRIHCLLCMRPTNTGNIPVPPSYPWPVLAS
jgi:uncharacterized protein (DUF433 family)